MELARNPQTLLSVRRTSLGLLSDSLSITTHQHAREREGTQPACIRVASNIYSEYCDCDTPRNVDDLH